MNHDEQWVPTWWIEVWRQYEHVLKVPAPTAGDRELAHRLPVDLRCARGVQAAERGMSACPWIETHDFGRRDRTLPVGKQKRPVRLCGHAEIRIRAALERVRKARRAPGGRRYIQLF